MVDPVSHQGERATVYTFPVRSILTLEDAAIYLGIGVLRLRVLGFIGSGPEKIKQSAFRSQFRIDALDRYRAVMFARAGISEQEFARYRARRGNPSTPESWLGKDIARIDPFMDLATRDELREVSAFLGGRIAIGVGVVVIMLSHTPAFRLLHQFLIHLFRSRS